MQTQVVFSQKSACWIRKNDQVVSVELSLFIAKSKSNRLRSALTFTVSGAVLPQKQRWDLLVARANLIGIWRNSISKNGVLLKIPSQERVLERDACNVERHLLCKQSALAVSSLCKSTLYYFVLLYPISSSHHYQGNACFVLSSNIFILGRNALADPPSMLPRLLSGEACSQTCHATAPAQSTCVWLLLAGRASGQGLPAGFPAN